LLAIVALLFWCVLKVLSGIRGSFVNLCALCG
jgi:hypothetical protein